MIFQSHDSEFSDITNSFETCVQNYNTMKKIKDLQTSNYINTFLFNSYETYSFDLLYKIT